MHFRACWGLLWVVHVQAKDFFDQYWTREQLRRFDRYDDFLQVVNGALFHKVEECGAQRILVIGMGETADRARLASLNADVVAIDIARDGLRFLQECTCIQMDVHHLAFKSRTFDAVFSRTTMLHCRHIRMIREIRRVLRNGGRFFWIEPLKHNPFLWVYRCAISPGRLTTMHYMTVHDFESLRNEFATVWHRECYLFTVLLLPLFIVVPCLRRTILFLQRWEMRLVDAIPWLRRWCWISYGYAGRGQCS